MTLVRDETSRSDIFMNTEVKAMWRSDAPPCFVSSILLSERGWSQFLLHKEEWIAVWSDDKVQCQPKLRVRELVQVHESDQRLPRSAQ